MGTPSDQIKEQWRKDFEVTGYRHLAEHQAWRNYSDPEKQAAAWEWIRDYESKQEARETAVHWYAKWTFWAALAAAILGLATVLEPFIIHHPM